MRITSVDLKAIAVAEAARLSRPRAVANHSTDGERRASDFDGPLTPPARELAIAACSSHEGQHMFQPGLFDRRSERGRRSEDTAAAEAGSRAQARVDRAANAGRVTSRRGELLLVLTP